MSKLRFIFAPVKLYKTYSIMILEVIYTFKDVEQTIYRFELESFMNYKKNFISFCKSHLSSAGKNNLVKISCCLRTEKTVVLPKWYTDCDGKFYFEDGKLLK